MTAPLVATYRLQLRGNMDFAKAAKLVPYLQRLGVSHLYLSPIFKARQGSTHGYDCVDPRIIDPALGGEEGFQHLTTVLHDHGLGLLLDIVPNHLGIGSEHPFWQAMLREGSQGQAARFFDVDWASTIGGVPNKVLLPFLGRPISEILEAGELELIDTSEPALRYHDHIFPLAPDTPEGSIEEILDHQHWRLAWWRCGNSLLNWRRFFDITELAGVRVEDDAVFEDTHKTLFELIDRGGVDGVRIDHIDGLADPTGYLDKLIAHWPVAGGQGPWVLVEKILGEDEDLPADWAVDGTTGYECLNAILGLFVDPGGLTALDATYRAFGGKPEAFQEILYAAKQKILDENLKAEFDRLVVGLLAEPDADSPRSEIETAIRGVILAFPYYRTYGTRRFSEDDRARLNGAFDKARSALVCDRAVFDLLRRKLSPKSVHLQRFEQLTGPAMAKAMEDTAFYRWYRLIALNEVGGEPDAGPVSVKKLHAFFGHRAARWPRALIATATHDTKRGEDTRLRIACLSCHAEHWNDEVKTWAHMAEPFRTGGMPSAEQAYFIFQTLVGMWPLTQTDDEQLEERLLAYLEKAFREAKAETSWTEPNTAFEQAIASFARGCLRDEALHRRIGAYCDELAPHAVAMSLAQITLKLTCPGIPDIYQGTELFDQSLVDPDNRRELDLDRLHEIPEIPPEEWRSGKLKQLVMAQILRCRKQQPRLFLEGTYTPLTIESSEQDGFFGFLREWDGHAAVTIVRHRGATIDMPDMPRGTVTLPDHLANRSWHDIVWGRQITSGPSIELSELASPATVLIATS